jgi:hypothetical protein
MIATLLSAPILGALTGLIGNTITAIFQFKQKKADNAHEEKMIELETNAMIKESEMKIEVQREEIRGEIELAEIKAYQESMKQGAVDLFDKSYMAKLYRSPWTSWMGALLSMFFGLVDILKALMRPGLTLYLTILATILTMQAYAVMKTYGQEITAAQAYALYLMVTETIIYLAVSCITWWFGDRRIAKFLMRNK